MTVAAFVFTTVAATPVIVPRRVWDPSPPSLRGVTRYRTLAPETFRWIVVHHSSFAEPPGPWGLKYYHQQVFRWADVGYQFIIGADGVVYEGRDLRFMGAHAGQTAEANHAVRRARRGQGGTVDNARRLDPDFGAIGIVVDGSFTDKRPGFRQQFALAQLVEHLQQRFLITDDHVISHREVRSRVVESGGLTFAGHDTVCPGARLQEVVEEIRR